MEKVLDVLVTDVRALRLEMAELRQEIGRYKGFVGGVAWALSLAGGAVGFLWGLLMRDGW